MCADLPLLLELLHCGREKQCMCSNDLANLDSLKIAILAKLFELAPTNFCRLKRCAIIFRGSNLRSLLFFLSLSMIMQLTDWVFERIRPGNYRFNSNMVRNYFSGWMECVKVSSMQQPFDYILPWKWLLSVYFSSGNWYSATNTKQHTDSLRNKCKFPCLSYHTHRQFFLYLCLLDEPYTHTTFPTQSLSFAVCVCATDYCFINQQNS